MTRIDANRGIAAVNVVALAVLLGACSDERGAQARAAEGGIVVAQAVPGPSVEGTLTPIDTPAPAPEPLPEPRYTNVTYDEAAGVFRRGRYGESAAMFTAYVEANPSNAFGHYMLGLSAWKSGDHDVAERALTSAMELDGESVKIRTNLGRVLLEQGRPTDALPHLEKAVELEPTSHEVWRVLGNVYARMDRSEDAIDAYRQALMLNDHDSWTMNNYGLLLIQLGRPDEALRPLARAVELVPLSPTFRNNLGAALESVGELEGARAAFAAAIEADSAYSKARTSLERVQTRLAETPMGAPDLSVFAQEFVDEMAGWVSEDQHAC